MISSNSHILKLIPAHLAQIHATGLLRLEHDEQDTDGKARHREREANDPNHRVPQKIDGHQIANHTKRKDGHPDYGLQRQYGQPQVGRRRLRNHDAVNVTGSPVAADRQSCHDAHEIRVPGLVCPGKEQQIGYQAHDAHAKQRRLPSQRVGEEALQNLYHSTGQW